MNWTDEDHELVRVMVDAGMSSKEIAAETGYSLGSIKISRRMREKPSLEQVVLDLTNKYEDLMAKYVQLDATVNRPKLGAKKFRRLFKEAENLPEEFSPYLNISAERGKMQE